MTWRRFVSSDAFDNYLDGAVSALTVRCPYCEITFPLLQPDEIHTPPAEEQDAVFADFLNSCRHPSEITATLTDYREGHLEVGLVLQALTTHGPFILANHLSFDCFDPFLQCVPDFERRVTLQLALLRKFPKIQLPCCSHKFCFVCQVASWHDESTCAERRAKEMQSADVQHCPECGVATLRTEGCASVLCGNCGRNWIWQTDTVQHYDQRIELGSGMSPGDDDAAWEAEAQPNFVELTVADADGLWDDRGPFAEHYNDAEEHGHWSDQVSEFAEHGGYASSEDDYGGDNQASWQEDDWDERSQSFWGSWD